MSAATTMPSKWERMRGELSSGVGEIAGMGIR